MGPKPFTPSINWSAAPMDSLRWLAIAWAIGAVCLLAVLVAFRYFTPWGRQFWRITRGYFVGRASVKVWLMLGVLLLSVLLSVRLVVLLSYQGNDLYTAVQKAVQGIAAGDDAVKQSGIHGFWMSIATFSVLAVLYVIRFMADIYLTQRFIIAWRMWLTAHLTDDWLGGRAYYRDLFIDHTIDNPDQRIQQDVDIFTANAGSTPNIPSNGTGSTLLFGAVNAVASVISFAAILWNLSGNLNVFGVELPRAMFWTVLVYVLVATVVAIWLGRPLIAPHHHFQRLELVGVAGNCSAAVGYPGAAIVRRQDRLRRCGPERDGIRQYPRLAVVFPQSIRRVRSLPRGDPPVAWAGRCQR